MATKGFLWTASIFLVSVACAPLMILCYIGVRVSHTLWYKWVALMHPDVEFLNNSTIRTLVDTHRNQGVIAVLMLINGPVFLDAVKKHLNEVVNRRDKLGNLLFPRLRQRLVTRWGTYAWQNCRFELDQNLVVSSATYRGRPISHANIQDYVSEIVSKYLPQGMSPWQLIVIPSIDHQHYLLLRLHHVLLYEKLNIADLFPIVAHTQPSTKMELHSPMETVLRMPKSIPYLQERLQEDLTNRWNEFISNHDPLEKPELSKTTPTITQFLSVLLITAFSIFKEINKRKEMIRSDLLSRLRFFTLIMARETRRRKVGVHSLFSSTIKTLEPQNLIRSVISSWYSCTVFTLKLPLLCLYEAKALYSCFGQKFCTHPDTLVGVLYNYGPLVYAAVWEGMGTLGHVIRAPRVIIQQLLSYPETLQIIPPCGRKVVAWSEPVKLQDLERIGRRMGAGDSEIFLTAVSVTLARYCRQAGIATPLEVPTVVRYIGSDYIFVSGPKVRPVDSIKGLITLEIPIIKHERRDALLDGFRTIVRNFANAVRTQPLTYLLTILQTKYGVITKAVPAILISVLLKYLSRKYTVSLTEIIQPARQRHRTIWGEEVVSAIYWRPPQANMSISFCFNKYDDHVRLGVMCDAQILPNHTILARQFSRHVREIANASGIQLE